MEIAGRQNEIAVLQKILTKRDARFLAVYGRRRIGKTYLIRQVYANNMVFECTGVLEDDMLQQLENFWRLLLLVNPQMKLSSPPETWIEAFFQLRDYLDNLSGHTKRVIFFDEIPWLETSSTGFLSALDSFWNDYCIKRKDIVLVVCGSAASWMIDRVVNCQGNLHNCLTDRLLLKPFTLGETKAFFELENIKLSLKDILVIYMCIGGVPPYLKQIEAGYSISKILDQLFFGDHAKLKDEFQNLYASLFKNNTFHEKIVMALASENNSLTRDQIVQTSGLENNDDLTKVLEELIQCGFIRQIYPMSKVKTKSLYRLIDEYSLFYFKFLVDDTTTSSWSQIIQTPAYKIWSGYAFENLCFKHTFGVKKNEHYLTAITNQLLLDDLFT